MYTSKVFLLEKNSFFRFCRKVGTFFFRITPNSRTLLQIGGELFSHT
jgi:hypothetical protein